MYRRGPSKSTPTSVQCQKCLKRGHYSYECKATTQERPYVSRPSRTQQLFNPKLVPKLASDTPDALQKQKGVADEELAKREAERAKKRELEGDESGDESPKRRRSASYDSVSSISTRWSASPPPRAQQSTAAHLDVPRRETSRGVRRDSYSSASEYNRRDDPNPQRSTKNDSPLGGPTRRSRSPARDDSPVRSYYDARDEAPRQRSLDNRRKRYSSSPSRSPPPRERRQFRSRSPDEPRRRDRSPPRDYERQASRDPALIHRNDRRRGGAPPRREQRERSLSPFSKRLALTQAMNTSR
ncbi:zinc knuckle-domain-containing protein [Daldinia decipiens]|uniref:zinc knuckle-domain-containing protein n=1 Tax=Daldinia decipiens TaxID=326647 RepID=UPI0020C45452|nr:zinc knuckle-domain-containing protein [Daldinia decipiens]KAI1657279.1 zinc knuckle-domain-containing protein [Daldinia decipiens]